MTAPTGDIVPFGKYKGRPMVDLISDRQYTDWLAAQPWFRQRYSTVYNLITGAGGPEPQDTPEHNAMQARFLDHDELLRIARMFLPDHAATMERWRFNVGIHLSEHAHANLGFAESVTSMVDRLKFENHGWDLLVTASSGVAVSELSKPGCSCACAAECVAPRSYVGPGTFDEPRTSGPVHLWSKCFRVNVHTRPDSDGRRRRHCDSACYFHWSSPMDYIRTLDSGVTWGGQLTLGVELKPVIGDDYPTILRDVLKRAEMCSARYCCTVNGAVVVVADRIDVSSVSVDDVRRIFKSQNVRLILSAELPAKGGEWACQCKACKS